MAFNESACEVSTPEGSSVDRTLPKQKCKKSYCILYFLYLNMCFDYTYCKMKSLKDLVINNVFL